MDVKEILARLQQLEKDLLASLNEAHELRALSKQQPPCPLPSNHQSSFNNPSIAHIAQIRNMKETALRIALKDQLRNIKVKPFIGEINLRAVESFFEDVELLFQTIGLQYSSTLPDEDSNHAIRVAQEYIGYEARTWLAEELERVGTTINTCISTGYYPFSWIELKRRMRIKFAPPHAIEALWDELLYMSRRNFNDVFNYDSEYLQIGRLIG